MAKSKWNKVKDKLILVEGWARDGLTEEQIAHNLGIGRTTLNDYKNKYPSFMNALKKGKEVIDMEVENALLKSALGFKYKEEAITNKGEVVEVERYEKPNTTAIIFWLKNRQKTKWRDKQDIEHSGEVTQNVKAKIDLTKLDDKDLDKLEEIASKLEDKPISKDNA
ncbi:hypothetical protein NL50_17325 [Clostridium acetobutylicum]|nr:hypothetical protein NL50_17325 [Clostridium acetobutylicum]